MIGAQSVQWNESNEKDSTTLQVHKNQPGRQTGDSKYANDDILRNLGYMVIGIATSLPN